MTTTVTSYSQLCTPGTVQTTSKVTKIINNSNVNVIPNLTTSLSIGDHASGIILGVAMLPCQTGDTKCLGNVSDPDNCAGGCSGVIADGCTNCACKTNIGVNFDVNDAGNINAIYYNTSNPIYEFPATINWWNGTNLAAADVYTPLSLPTAPTSVEPPTAWTNGARTVSFYVVNDFLFAIARVDVNNSTLDTSGRKLYASLSTAENVRMGSQVAILCYNSLLSTWSYLALSSVSGYQANGVLAATAFNYPNWSTAWTVWRTIPSTGGIASTHPFYGDGVWNVWDPNGAGITNVLFQGNVSYLQNWLVSTSTDQGITTWANAYTAVPTNLTDLAARTGYMARFNTALPGAGSGAIYDVFRDNYLLDATTSCLTVQIINRGYAGADDVTVQPLGTNQSYYGVPLLGVSETLSSLANNAAGITDQTTCVQGVDSDDGAEVEPPACNCGNTKQFFLWFYSAYGGCLQESETVCIAQSSEPQSLPSTAAAWVPWVVGILAALVIILLGFVIWYTIRYKNLEKFEESEASGDIGFTPNAGGYDNATGISVI